jgi:polysaccharide export outer membrane protein
MKIFKSSFIKFGVASWTGMLRAGQLLLLLTVIGLTATAQQPGASSPLPAPAPARTAPNVTAPDDVSATTKPAEIYRIGPGDVLDIRVYNRPQLSREAVRVDGRGMIRMPLIDGEIQAGCRSEEELSQDIYTRYQKYYRRPHVDVFIKEYNSTPVAVIGAVDRPGRFQLQRPVRLLELISLAGGPTERAGGRLQIAHTPGVSVCKGATTTVVSDEDATRNFIAYNLVETLRGEDQANPYVQPGDIITLPEADQAYVVGNVLRPTAIALKEPITVTRAIAMAGGTMPDTKSKQIRIVRQIPGSTNKKEIFVDLSAIDKRQAEDIALQANDIIDVPTASGKRFLRSLFGGVVPAVTQLPVQIIR